MQTNAVLYYIYEVYPKLPVPSFQLYSLIQGQHYVFPNFSVKVYLYVGKSSTDFSQHLIANYNRQLL